MTPSPLATPLPHANSRKRRLLAWAGFLIACVMTLAAAALVAFWYIFEKIPTTLADLPIPPDFLHEVKSGAPWARSPVQVALALTHGPGGADGESDMEITYQTDGLPRPVVTILTPSEKDDSIFSTFNRIELELAPEGYWYPVSLKGCWRGRGLTGWSITPPL